MGINLVSRIKLKQRLKVFAKQSAEQNI